MPPIHSYSIRFPFDGIFAEKGDAGRLEVFQIRGEATVSMNEETGGEVFEGSFEIVEGSGHGVFEGVSGGGKMIVRFGDRRVGEERFGEGECVFEGMNEVGMSLM